MALDFTLRQWKSEGKPDAISVFRKIPLAAKLRMQRRKLGWKQTPGRRPVSIQEADGGPGPSIWQMAPRAVKEVARTGHDDQLDVG